MNIKAYLKDYPFINIELHRLQKELNILIQGKHETYCSLKAVNITGMPSAHIVTDSVFQCVQVLVERYDHKIQYYTGQINRLLDDKSLFERIWFNNKIMTNEDRAMIQLKYFEHKSWRKVSEILNYSDKQCQRILEKAMQKMQWEVDRLSDGIKSNSS